MLTRYAMKLWLWWIGTGTEEVNKELEGEVRDWWRCSKVGGVLVLWLTGSLHVPASYGL